MNGEAQTEDLTILAALEALERGIVEAPAGANAAEAAARPDETAEMLARLYTEALGLIAYELDPVAPAPEVKFRLMSIVDGDETQPAITATPAAAAEPARPPVPAPPAPAVVPAPATLPRPAQERPAQEHRAPRMAAVAASRPSGPRRWPLALAAALALVLLGLSSWLYSQLAAQRALLGSQRATIASLQRELSLERGQSEGAVARARQLETDSLDLREKFALVTSPAVAVSPMRPVGRPPLQPDARGVLFVAADHQHWYLALQGLQPVPAGKVYKLWFVASQGTVSAGSFSAQPGAPVELSSKSMAAGTRGALVTLEDDPQATAPAGPAILRVAAVYTIS